MQRQSEPQARSRGVENFIKKYNYCPKRNHSNTNTDNKTANKLVEDKYYKTSTVKKIP
ncbi:MAG: hypothetical protein MRQ13_04230 [Candidatus Midichloria sp.]|nr:hypothetical protein [Candidatus Midichloria sp.]